MNEEKIELTKKELEILLDMAYTFTGTYEGGLTSKEKVEALRHSAELLGFDPIEYTPYDEKENYKHKPKMQGVTRFREDRSAYVVYRCDYCLGPEDIDVHKEERWITIPIG